MVKGQSNKLKWIDEALAAERKARDKEAAEAYKARYPIDDALLALEPEPQPPLAAWPQPRYRLNLEPQLQQAGALARAG